MDPITHVLLGSATAQAAARAGQARQAALAGSVAGIVPDLDMLLPTGGDSLTALLLHRNFSHSIVFMPLGALLAAGLVWLLLRRGTPFARVYLWSLLGIIVHAPLDALNAYGTTLYWPFNDTRVAWPIMPVVEVVFTTGLLLALALAAWHNRVRPARLGLLFAVGWLALAAVQYERAQTAVAELAASRGESIERLLVQPTIGNIVLWSTRYKVDGDIRTDAIYLGPLGARRVYAGDRVPVFRVEEKPWIPQDSRVAHDVARFAWFADGWLIRDPDDISVIGDARYAMPPHRSRPLWGVRYNPDDLEEPMAFEHVRSVIDRDWIAFVRMVGGHPVDDLDTDATLWRPLQPEPIE